jgi:hypothetical protein
VIYNERIQALIQLGYTAREAAFLVLVCRVSGYFTRAQYNAFARRESGGLAQQLIDRALQKQHVRVIECSRNWHIYHVTAPVIYQRIEGSDSTSRRLKGDDEIRRRLMVLATCIRRADARILGSEAEKASFFAGLDVPRQVIPWAQNAADELAITKISDTARRLPVLVAGQKAVSPRITFLFADPGFASTTPFERYLETLIPLFANLRAIEVVYICEPGSSVRAAEAAFDKALGRAFPGNSPELFPRGVEHFISFLEAERRWNANAPDLSTEDVRLLNEGEAIYTAGLHAKLRTANSRGPEELFRRLSEIGITSKSRFAFLPELVELPRTLERDRKGPKRRVSQVNLPLSA